MDNAVAGGGQQPGPADAAPGRWRQHAGFSIFFDAQPTGSGGSAEPGRRTRLYHEETGNEATFRGWEPADWVRWVLEQLGSPRPPSEPAGATAALVSMEIVDVRLVGDPGPAPADDSVAVELQLRVTGMAELRRTLGARVVGVLFGPYPQ